MHPAAGRLAAFRDGYILIVSSWAGSARIAYRGKNPAAGSHGHSIEIVMKKINRHVPDVPQGIADRGTEIIERHFNAYGVKRGCELPEEGKVHLYREMQQYFAVEMPGGLEIPPPAPWWTRAAKWARRFFTGD
jgi:hypothetical protein